MHSHRKPETVSSLTPLSCLNYSLPLKCPSHAPILQGDSLIVECEYDSTRRKVVTYDDDFGLRQRLHETDTVRDRPRSGRPRCTTQRQDRNLVRNHVINRFLSASASSRQTRGRNNQRISANTVTRRLSTSGLRARRPYIGPILAQRHRH
ncbi:transposable element Tc1 transposase [Elysia marginata]|uniref:Transposable element Tc1 transposase n=1 Tax=Elysia marginata TaxID=1093978 RepID=A0AAV4EQ22_9GAST|nr:transposable element Tc1 transposase [Elysia marginata]